MKKWLENFWYHYKVGTIITICIIILAIVTVFQIKTRVKTDLDVVVASADTLVIKNIEQFETQTQELIKDANDDEKVVCTVNNAIINDKNGMTMTNADYLDMLVLTIASGDSKLYIADDAMMEYLMNQNVCQEITYIYDKMNLPHDGKQYYYKTSTQNPVLQSLNLRDEYCYVIVRIRNSAIKDTEEQDIQYQNAYSVLEKIIEHDLAK